MKGGKAPQMETGCKKHFLNTFYVIFSLSRLRLNFMLSFPPGFTTCKIGLLRERERKKNPSVQFPQRISLSSLSFFAVIGCRMGRNRMSNWLRNGPQERNDIFTFGHIFFCGREGGEWWNEPWFLGDILLPFVLGEGFVVVFVLYWILFSAFGCLCFGWAIKDIVFHSKFQVSWYTFHRSIG